MTRLGGATVLVTGGAIGLGRQMTEQFLAAGAARAVIWDIHEANLQRTCAELRGRGHAVEARVVDVADAGAVAEAARTVLAEIGPVDVLVNNAGIVVGKPFVEHTTVEIERTIRINVLGLMHVTAAFLPSMIERGRGHVVNLSSAAGLTPNPNMSVYVASKWAVLGWSESLRLELERTGHGLRVTTVTPSYVATGMFEGVRAPRWTPIQRPETLAEAVVRAVREDRILVRAPFMVRLLPLVRGLLPARVFDRLIGRGFGVYTTMDTFVGRPPEGAAAERERRLEQESDRAR